MIKLATLPAGLPLSGTNVADLNDASIRSDKSLDAELYSALNQSWIFSTVASSTAVIPGISPIIHST